MRAAGFAVTPANGRATTIPGLTYQFMSRPKISRTSGYENLFPSASAKYSLGENLQAHLGYSSTISRPSIGNLGGVWVFNETNQTVSVPNRDLLPERSRNLSGRVAYYFEPVGSAAVTLFQNRISNSVVSREFPAEAFGYGEDPLYSGYRFLSVGNRAGTAQVRGMTLEYSQALSFLPGALRGLNASASYTRSYASIPKANMVPHSINAGLSYSYRQLNAYTNLNWRDNYPSNISLTTPRFYRHRANLDIGGGYRITPRMNFFFSARNIFNEPYLIMEKVGANAAVVQFYEVNGINWTCGIKHVF